MPTQFPYPVLNKQQLNDKLNHLGSGGMPFLFIIDYKAEKGYIIEKNELDEGFVRFFIQAEESTNLAKRELHHPPSFNWQLKPLSLEKSHG